MNNFTKTPTQFHTDAIPRLYRSSTVHLLLLYRAYTVLNSIIPHIYATPSTRLHQWSIVSTLYPWLFDCL